MKNINTREVFNVYFIRPVGELGPIKIGISNDPIRRLKEFSGWSPVALEIVGSVPGSWSDEQFLHSALANYHLHGEWFAPGALVILAMNNIIETGGFDVVRRVLTPVKNLRSEKNRATRAAGTGLRKYPRERSVA
jgi:hypothetical protein